MPFGLQLGRMIFLLFDFSLNEMTLVQAEIALCGL